MRNKIGSGRAVKRGTRLTHRGVRYKIIGSGFLSRIIREDNGSPVAETDLYETPREAIDRALGGGRLDYDLGPWPKRRQHGRILGWHALARQQLLRRRV